MSIRLRTFRASVAVALTSMTCAWVLATPAQALPVVNPGLTAISSGVTADPDGTQYINVLLKNTGSSYIIWAEAAIGFYDKSGHEITSVGSNPGLHWLAPGETSGQTIEVLPMVAGYDHWAIDSLTGMTTTTPPNHNFTVKITSVTDGAFGDKVISGTLTNRNTVAAGWANVALDFYDASGKYVTSGEAELDSSPAPLGGGATESWSYDYTATTPFATVKGVGEDKSTPQVPPTGCIACAPFSRVAGSTRTGTAVAASQAQYGAGAAKAVVLARDDKFPDALAGGPLASHVDGPLLLTSPTGLDLATENEIQRVAPSGSTVYILGGPAAIASSVDDELTALGYLPKRIYGDTRFATAVAIAKEMGSPSTIFEATGLNYPDALAGGPAAAAAGAAILLTNGSQQAPETAAYLASLPTSTRYALGGPAANADPSATPIVGADRFDTSNRVAQKFFPTPTKIGLATAYNFPDALGAGPLLAAQKAPLILVPSAGVLSSSTYDYLTNDAQPSVAAGTVFGGNLAVSAQTVTCIQMDLAGTQVTFSQ